MSHRVKGTFKSGMDKAPLKGDLGNRNPGRGTAINRQKPKSGAKQAKVTRK